MDKLIFILLLFLFCVIAVCILISFFKRKSIKKIDYAASEAAAKKTEEYIEKTDSMVLLSHSDDPAGHRDRIEQRQQTLRERIRNRLNRNVHRDGSGGYD